MPTERLPFVWPHETVEIQNRTRVLGSEWVEGSWELSFLYGMIAGMILSIKSKFELVIMRRTTPEHFDRDGFMIFDPHWENTQRDLSNFRG